MHSAVQLAGFHYIACLKAVPTSADHSLAFGNSTYSFLSIATADSGVLRAEFQRWATSAVLRDLVEHFSVFLLAVYSDALAANPDTKFVPTPAQFERLGVEAQLAALAANFPVDNAWTSRLIAYNKARNCLAHRVGVVGLQDVTENDELVVRWLTAKVALHEGSIEKQIEARGPMAHLIQGEHVGGKAATIEVLDRERRFKIGSPISFMPDELLGICQTLHAAAAAYDTLVTSSPSSRK